MDVRVEPQEFVVTIKLTKTEYELLRDRAELAHVKFEGDDNDHLNVMGELHDALKKALKVP